MTTNTLANVAIKTHQGGTVTIPAEALEAFRGALRGTLALPGEPAYETARTVWNAMIDRKPALIVRAAGAADVIRTVNLAREHGLVLSVRGGGHNIAGSAVCEGGLMLDLTPMKSVHVDPAGKTVRVEPGATLGDLDRETQMFGLSVPVGINSTTGVSGLTLGAGFGWTSRSLGLSIDNLLSADVVTADGKLLKTGPNQNADLFWAIRGGGGNFGVVTSFEFKLHAVGPEVQSGLVIHPLTQAKELLREYRRLAAEAPNELAIWFVMRKAPPLPFLPPDFHGAGMLAFAACYTGGLDAGAKAIAPLQKLGSPIADVMGPKPFVAWQAVLDPLLTPGFRNYWKSHFFTDITDAMIDIMIEHANRLPSPHCEIAFAQLGGVVATVAPDATAYPHRAARFTINVHTRWEHASEDAACIAWARSLVDALAPHATGGVYVNFMPEDETARVKTGAYGANFDKLAQVKAKYDPTNLFRHNQNIAPKS